VKKGGETNSIEVIKGGEKCLAARNSGIGHGRQVFHRGVFHESMARKGAKGPKKEGRKRSNPRAKGPGENQEGGFGPALCGGGTGRVALGPTGTAFHSLDTKHQREEQIPGKPHLEKFDKKRGIGQCSWIKRSTNFEKGKTVTLNFKGIEDGRLRYSPGEHGEKIRGQRKRNKNGTAKET